MDEERKKAHEERKKAHFDTFNHSGGGKDNRIRTCSFGNSSMRERTGNMENVSERRRPTLRSARFISNAEPYWIEYSDAAVAPFPAKSCSQIHSMIPNLTMTVCAFRLPRIWRKIEERAYTTGNSQRENTKTYLQRCIRP